MKILMNGAMSKYCYNINIHTFQCGKKPLKISLEKCIFIFCIFLVFAFVKNYFTLYFLKTKDSTFVHFFPPEIQLSIFIPSVSSHTFLKY